MVPKLSYGKRLEQGVRKHVGAGIWKKEVEVFSFLLFQLSLSQRECVCVRVRDLVVWWWSGEVRAGFLEEGRLNGP